MVVVVIIINRVQAARVAVGHKFADGHMPDAGY
jgi:hypothetical protein